MPPQGLRVVIQWAPAEEIPFDYREVWLALVLYQSFLAGFRKTALLNGGYRITMPISKTKMTVFGGYNGIRFGEAVWGLFETGNQIARRYPTPSPVLGSTSSIYTAVGYRGKLTVRRTNNPVMPANGTSVPSTIRKPIIEASRYGESGIVISLDDPNLEIHYEFNGQPIPGSHMLTAFLRSVTYCSEYAGYTTDVSITAFSYNFLFRIQMDKTQVSGPNQLNWHLALLAVKTLWMQVVMRFDEPTTTFHDQPRFESLSYKIEYREVRIGQGWIG